MSAIPTVTPQSSRHPAITVLSPSVALTSSRKAVLLGCIFTVLLALFGVLARYSVALSGLGAPRANNIFFRLFELHEGGFLVLMLLWGLLALLVALRPADTRTAGRIRLPEPSPRNVGIFAIVVLAVTIAATFLVMHELLFSMDEFSVDFQARLFASGRLSGTVPAAWRPFAGLLTPIFVNYRPETGHWLTMYLPVYAAIKAPFVALGAGALLNPIMAALAVIATGGAARRLWPGETLQPWIAMLLLAFGAEFVMTSASGYSMPAHLALNLVWLWLYLRDDARSWTGALIVGALAMGLHQPIPHPLFVAPFIVRLARDRRWQRLGAAAVVYGIASVAWLFWIRAVQPVAASGTGGLVSLFALPNRNTVWLNLVNLSLLFTWQAPIVGILALAALAQARRFGPVMADLAWGIVLTLGFYLFYPQTQGHGWGYRYAYQVIGNLVLLAAAGVVPLREALGERRARLMLGAGLATAVAVQLPWRLIQTERFVRPFAAANALVHSQDADVVLVRADSIWYARDLVRNDPYLHRPVVLGEMYVSTQYRPMLREALRGVRVVEVTDADLLKVGMTRWTHPVP